MANPEASSGEGSPKRADLLPTPMRAQPGTRVSDRLGSHRQVDSRSEPDRSAAMPAASPVPPATPVPPASAIPPATPLPGAARR